MTRIERILLMATAVVFVVGLGVWLALGGPSALGRKRHVDDESVPPVGKAAPAAPLSRPRVIEGGAGSSDPSSPGSLAAQPASSGAGGIPPGLRQPTGEDLSNPETVKALLRAQLSAEDPRWDTIAQLLAVLHEPLDGDLRGALENALLHGNAAGAIQAYERLHDGTVIPDLLRALDTPGLSDHDRNNVLQAISSIPGADLKQAITGIEDRMTRDYKHDLPFLKAIARLGGREAARAFADAIIHSPNPKEFGIDSWRDFDLRTSKEASDDLARLLRGSVGTPDATKALVEFAGRPGATPDLVDALKNLDAEAQPQPVRTQALNALARTGDDKAIEHLLAVAARGADYASVAARALADTNSLSEASRSRLLDTAKSTNDDFLRQNIVEALGNVKAVQAVPMLTDFVTSGSDLVKAQSVVALGRVGERAASSIDALQTAYGTGDENLRLKIVITLGQIKTVEARRLVEQLRVAEKSERVQRSIAGVMGQFARNDPK